MSDEMDRAYRQDAEDQRRMDDARRALLALIAEPPSRCSQRTIVALGQAANLLKQDSDHVTAVWN